MSDMVLQIRGLKTQFDTRGGILTAVDYIDLELRRGETLGLVGESGCGKSTIARLILKLLHSDSGKILFQNQDCWL